MTSEEKLAKVEELLRARDVINEELLELMGTEVADEEEKGDENVPAPRQRKILTSSSGKGCAECGSTGRHKKTCSKASSAKSASPKAAEADADDDGVGAVMGPQTYNNVKMLKGRGKHSKEISEQLDLSVREVNAAMSSSDYTHYLDIREAE